MAASKVKAKRSSTPPIWYVGRLSAGLLGSDTWGPRLGVCGGMGTALAQTFLDVALTCSGLVLGCANAWHWISARSESMHDSEDPP